MTSDAGHLESGAQRDGDVVSTGGGAHPPMTGGEYVAHAPVHDISLDPNYDPAYGRVLHRGPASIWPFVTAAAIALAGSVLVLNWFIFIPAAFLFVWAFRAWMTELLHEEPHEH